MQLSGEEQDHISMEQQRNCQKVMQVGGISTWVELKPSDGQEFSACRLLQATTWQACGAITIAGLGGLFRVQVRVSQILSPGSLMWFSYAHVLTASNLFW